MRHHFNNSKKVMYFSFLSAFIIFFFLLALNYKGYKEGIKAQEELFGRKQYADVVTRSNSIEEKMNHSIEALKFIRDGFLTEYIKGEYEIARVEGIMNTEINSEKGFTSAYVLFVKDKKNIAVYYDEKAAQVAEAVYSESKKSKEEICISDFRLSMESQYIAISLKIDEESRVIAVYNFKYVVDKFIQEGSSGDYRGYFILDNYGNVVFDYDREIIGENIFILHSDNEPLKKQLKKYLNEERGRGIYFIKTRGINFKIVRKFTAWNSIEVYGKKIILCSSIPDQEIEKVLSKMTMQVRYTYIILAVLFIIFVVVIFYYFKRKEEKIVNNTIKQERDRLELVINESESSFWEYYIFEHKIYFSENFYEITGYDKEKFMTDIESLKNLVPMEDIINAKKIIVNAIKSKELSFTFESRIKKNTGKVIWFLSKGKIVQDEKGDNYKVIGFLTEITKIKQKEIELISFKTAVEQSPVTIVITDTEGKITYVNKKFTTLTGYTKKEILGENPRILNSGQHDKEFYRNMWDTLIAGAIWSGDLVNRKKNGEIYYERANIASITDEMKRIIGYVSVKEDITQQKELAIKMEKFATRDALTGVFNRRAGLDFLEQQIKIAERNAEKFSIIYIDINNLKSVNDNLGHNYGDSMIVEICGGIKEEIRSSDILARIGGDEFIIVMPLCEKTEAEIIWKRVIKSYEYLNDNFNRNYKLSASYGIFEYVPGSKINLDTILEEADRRMYEEKKKMKEALKMEEKNV